MRLVLSIIAGPASGQSISILPGQKVRVGRQVPSEYIIEADHYLSGIHFAVSNVGGRCLIEDLESRNGLFINGKQIQQTELRPHDTIGAGLSKFVADFDEDVATGIQYASEPLRNSETTTLAFEIPAENTLRGSVAQIFSEEPENLFCVLDSAQDDAILELLERSNAPYEILYEGSSAEELANYGPYLVELSHSDELLHRLIEKGWGKNWGIFIKTQQPFPELRRHLRQFLLVELANGTKVLFRFYDPRVMRLVVASFTLAEANQFFGPIASFFCESAEPSEILKLKVGLVGVESSVIHLVPRLR